MGCVLYVGDLSSPWMQHREVLRVPHACLEHVGTRPAELSGGVVRVLAGWAVTGSYGVAAKDQYPSAREKVRCAGEPSAVVIAGG